MPKLAVELLKKHKRLIQGENGQFGEPSNQAGPFVLKQKPMILKTYTI